MLLLLALGIVLIAIPLSFLPIPPPRPGQPIWVVETKPTAFQQAIWHHDRNY